MASLAREPSSPVDDQDTGRRTLALIAAIAFAFAAVWAFIFLTQKPPFAAGVITGLIAVPIHTELRQGGNEQEGHGGGVEAEDQVLVLVNTTVKNTSKIPLFPYEQTGVLTLPTGEQKHVRAVSPNDMMRAFREYPGLAAAHLAITGFVPTPALARETTLQPQQAEHGLVLFAFPLSKQDWETRRSFDLELGVRWQRPLELAEPEPRAAP